MSLVELESLVKRQNAFIDFPNRPWMPETTSPRGHLYDVVIVGAGQSGLAAAYGLMREQVTNIIVLDAAREGEEGPWTTFARMITLRTPKMLSGLDFGNPSLSPRAWFEAQWGRSAWDELTKIPRGMWQDYLIWYRRVLGIPVRNESRIIDIAPAPAAGLSLRTADGTEYLARKLILCTGLDGSGRWEVPSVVREALPRDRYAHTADAIDFDALTRRRVGVLGNGASAFDNAAMALEEGAAQVSLCLRKESFPRVNVHKWMETPGFLGHFASLPDLARWRFLRQVTSVSQPPPQDTFWRCKRHANFSLHTGAAWTAVAMDGDEIVVDTPKGRMHFDFLIAGTGISHALHLRPELAGIANEIATWNDVFTPPADEADAYLGRAPYLGAGFEFQERRPGAAPYLRRIHNFSYGATLSMGLSAASISGMRYGIPRLVRGVVGDLFREDQDRHFASLLAYSDEEISTLELPDDPSLIPGPPIATTRDTTEVSV
ncbi:oxidoreductase (plasmid) [Mesorhizobium loti NZP2037]|nr:NAD(P)/FAD-dependent oxidoreductase [Mesorhizobium loti]ANN61947.1 oxidoreductase [Mesorhizobium loti NZP2037]